MATKRWTHLMIHHSDGPPGQTVDAIRAYHTARPPRGRGWSDIAYHYLIQRDDRGKGHLKGGRPTSRNGAHAGTLAWNSKALGLCIIGRFAPGGEVMLDALYADVLAAVLHIMRLHGIPPANLLAHRDVRATECPGEWFPMQRLREDVRRALG